MSVLPKNKVSLVTYSFTFVVLLAVLILSKFRCLASSMGLTLSDLQYLAVPFTIFAAWRFRLMGKSIPRFVLSLAIVGGVLSAILAYSGVGINKKTVLVARLVGDEFEAASRVFREQIKEAARGERDIQLRRYHAPLAGYQEAQKLLADSGALAVIWGTKHWLSVSFAAGKDFFLGNNEIVSWEKMIGLKPVSSVSVIGMSRIPEPDTVRFLASFLVGSSIVINSGASSSEVDYGRMETELLSAATIRAHWTSYAHRAFPFWVLGNFYLQRGLQDGRYERAYLLCAIRAYTRARELLRYHENPELLAAILNNRAFVHFLIGWMEHRSDLKETALVELKVAAQLERIKNPFGYRYRAVDLAKRNLLRLKHRLETRNAVSFQKKRRTSKDHAVQEKKEKNSRRGANNENGGT